jgi:hypothetical protein
MQKGMTMLVLVLLIAIGLMSTFYVGSRINQKSTENTNPQPSVAPIITTSSPSASGSAKTPPPTATPKPTGIKIEENSSFKTYNNFDLGFKFNFPKSLVLSSASSKDFLQFLENQNGKMASRMNVSIKNNSSKMPLESFIQNEKYSNFDGSQKTDYDKELINGSNGLLLTKNVSMKDLCNFEDDSKSRQIFQAIFTGNKDTVIWFIANNSCETFKTNWFNAIVTSFTLIK